MSFPAWAYDVSNFISPPEEEFICSICRCVFCDPMQSPCNHVFCKKCITRWVGGQRSCPLCRQFIGLYDLKKVMPLFQNLILKLKLRCFNARRGCEEILTQEGCVAHLRSCPYELVLCSNSPCIDMVERRMIVDHEKRKCRHAKYSCEKCGLVIYGPSSESHDCITELKNCAEDLREKLKRPAPLVYGRPCTYLRAPPIKPSNNLTELERLTFCYTCKKIGSRCDCKLTSMLVKMSFPAWAYDVSNFISPPEEEFICSICKGVFCIPMQSPCNHVFCKNCITRWVLIQKNCPLCRQDIGLYGLKKVMPWFQNMILKLKFRCFNTERGCKEIITQEGCVAHLRSCPYELVQCSNSPCTDMVERRMIVDHEKKECPHAKYPCQKCGLVISVHTSESHDCITYLKSCVQELRKILRERNKIIDEFISIQKAQQIRMIHDQNLKRKIQESNEEDS